MLANPNPSLPPLPKRHAAKPQLRSIYCIIPSLSLGRYACPLTAEVHLAELEGGGEGQVRQHAHAPPAGLILHHILDLQHLPRRGAASRGGTRLAAVASAMHHPCPKQLAGGRTKVVLGDRSRAARAQAPGSSALQPKQATALAHPLTSHIH